MTAPTATGARAPRGHYRFRHVTAMEWHKLRTLRSTWWTVAITVAGAVAVAVVIRPNTRNAAGGLTNKALAGVVPGLLGPRGLRLLGISRADTLRPTPATPLAR